MDQPTCSTCRHHSGGQVGADLRECRFNPPVFAREWQAKGGGIHPVFLGRWPLTLPDDHCGMHTPISAQETAPEVEDGPVSAQETAPVPASPPEVEAPTPPRKAPRKPQG